jgi:SAM-dependent methyltransferase
MTTRPNGGSALPVSITVLHPAMSDSTNPIEYEHWRNRHTVDGPRKALPVLLGAARPGSLLDVGCGTGSWLRAALDFGIRDVRGVDGVPVPDDQRAAPAERMEVRDLRQSWDLGRKYDVAICLEVAEHIESACEAALFDTLTRHSDLIIFSAACPGQNGQHHVNCQWPSHWQARFNERGFAARDDVRWQIWESDDIEPWYRQNVFIARREPANAGKEPRIRSVVHPDMVRHMWRNELRAEQIEEIRNGAHPVGWYARTLLTVAGRKLGRQLPGVGRR